MRSRRCRWIGRVSLLGLVFGLVGAWLLAPAPAAPAGDGGAPYRSPIDLAWSPDGKLIAVADHTANSLALIDPASAKIVREIAVSGAPASIAWSADGGKLYVSQRNAHSVAEIGAADGKVIRTIPTGHYPHGVAVVAKKQLLLVGNTASGEVAVIDLAAGKEKARVKAVREPWWIAVSPDESLAMVSNLLPEGSAAEPGVSGAVSLIDLEKMAKIADIKLPPNTTAIRQVAISPDGKWGYAVHTVGRTMLPATQLERGWVNTNAMSVIDLKNKQLHATVLLDLLSEGAADPWGITLAKDGATAWISLAGVHQIARIDLAGLHKNLNSDAGPTAPATQPIRRSYSSQAIWAEIQKSTTLRLELVNDLAALYVANLIQRPRLEGKAPRGIGISPDGKQLAVAMYYGGEVQLLDPGTCKQTSKVSMGASRPIDDVRKGEIVFHDAQYAFQHWLSCASCHPNNARVDGMNWDLPNDGLGNPKNVRSLLWAHKTPPAMTMGVREDMEHASAAGFRFQMHQPPPEDQAALITYLKSLEPERSPFRLANGELSDKAKKGKAIFESPATGCASCHSGEAFTNLKQYDVGTQGPLDHKDQSVYDTPTLVELWRTAPYLHDGRAVTLQQVFTEFNKQDKHGKTSQLSKDDLDALVEYLLSL